MIHVLSSATATACTRQMGRMCAKRCLPLAATSTATPTPRGSGSSTAFTRGGGAAKASFTSSSSSYSARSPSASCDNVRGHDDVVRLSLSSSAAAAAGHVAMRGKYTATAAVGAHVDATTEEALKEVQERLGVTLSEEATVPSPHPTVIVISGPSGVGKDAVIRRLQELRPELHMVVTATSRAMRPREVDGVDYFFVTTKEFEDMIEQGELIEHAVVYGEYKGIPKQQVRGERLPCLC